MGEGQPGPACVPGPEPGSVHASGHGQPGPGQQQVEPAAVPYRPRGCPVLGKGAAPSSLPVIKYSILDTSGSQKSIPVY